MCCPKRYFLALFVVLALALASRAQTNRATLEGTVTDKSGGTISGANVKITEVDTGISQERKTNSNGYYRFPGLAVGEYTVTVSNTSFKTKILEDVELEVGETHTLDVPLEVGAIEEKVEIKAEAGPAERSSAEQATVIRSDQIANLPVNGRNWASLTLLAPFAQDDGGGDQRTIHFAGRSRDDNNFSFDGVDAGGIQEQAQKSQTRLQISEDAVAEYRVNSALYDAEYGTQAGGQIDIVTKSGSDDLHGTAFGYLRNSAFDARNFTDPPAISPFRMGQYGLTVGGPIKKGKTFYFLSYEGLRQLQENTTGGLIFAPSASFVRDILVNGRNGGGPSPQMCSILQAFPWRVSTGTVGGCAPKLIFADSDFSPLTPIQAGQIVAPDLPADIENFTQPVPTVVHEDTWLVRIDHKFSDKTTLYGRAQRDISLADAPNGSTASPADKLRVINHPANYFLALQRIFTSNLFNEAKVYVNRSPFHNPQASALTYSVVTNNFVTLNDNTADVEVGTTYGFIDSLTWTHGRHAFKTGMEIRRIRLNQGMTADNVLNFSDDQSLITASLSNITFHAPWCCHGLRRTFLMPYFQDEWKVTPTFTANLGIRWEYYGVVNVSDNRTTVFDLDQFHGVCLGSGSFNAPPSPAPINTPPCPKNPALYNPDYKNFDPRVSFAWAPGRFKGKTVLRSGFGIYHGAAQNDDLNAALESDTFRAVVTPSSGFIPLSPAFQQTTPDLSGFTGANGFNKAANHPRALQREGRRDLYAEEWGLTIEHELPASFLLSTSYLGTHGVRLFSRGAVNLCTIPVTFNNSGDCNRPLDPFYTFPDPNNPGQTLVQDPFGSVDIKRDIGTSTYHAFTFALERRFNNGLSFQSRYTFSHSINDGSVGGGQSTGPENVNCRLCDTGSSIFDIRHNFTANAVYELPFGRGKAFLHGGGVLGKIVGGWEFSSVGIWHTGHPLTVLMNLPGSDTFLLPDGNDQTNQRPDIVPGVPLTLPRGGKNGVPLINAAAFQAPPVDSNGNFTRFGNEGNDVIRALNSWQVDLALMKETKLTERFALHFGVQAFNVFNHVQLGDPANFTLNYDPTAASTGFLAADPNFGVINGTVNFNNNNDNKSSPNTGTGLPRQLQLMLRLKF
jgi:hypothetical protein